MFLGKAVDMKGLLADFVRSVGTLAHLKKTRLFWRVCYIECEKFRHLISVGRPKLGMSPAHQSA